MFDLSQYLANYVRYKRTEYIKKMGKKLDWVKKNHAAKCCFQEISKHKNIGKLTIGPKRYTMQVLYLKIHFQKTQWTRKKLP